MYTLNTLSTSRFIIREFIDETNPSRKIETVQVSYNHDEWVDKFFEFYRKASLDNLKVSGHRIDIKSDSMIKFYNEVHGVVYRMKRLKTKLSVQMIKGSRRKNKIGAVEKLIVCPMLNIARNPKEPMYIESIPEDVRRIASDVTQHLFLGFDVA